MKRRKAIKKMGVVGVGGATAISGTAVADCYGNLQPNDRVTSDGQTAIFANCGDPAGEHIGIINDHGVVADCCSSDVLVNWDFNPKSWAPKVNVYKCLNC